MSKQTVEIAIPESLNMDGLELRGNYRIIGYRQDILHALERKHVAAYIVTALLRWTKSKRDDLIRVIKRRAENKLPPLTEAELEIWIHMSYEEFADEFDGLFSHNTIKDAVSYLLNKEIIHQRKNPNPKFKDYEYRLMLPGLRELLRSLPVNPVHRTRDNRNRKGKQSPNLVTPPEMVTSPNPANESPKMVDEPPKMVDESPELVNHYTMSTQIQTKSSTERKNDEPSTNASFIPSIPPQEEEVEFSLEEDAVYSFGKQTIFKVKPPKKTQKVKDQCAEIAKAGIKTLEQMLSLVAFAKQETGFGTIHLGNLVNALNGWLLTQQFPTVSSSRTTSKVLSSYDDEDYIDDSFYPTRKVESIHGTH